MTGHRFHGLTSILRQQIKEGKRLSLSFRLETTSYPWWSNMVSWLSQGLVNPTDNNAAFSMAQQQGVLNAPAVSARFDGTGGGGTQLPKGEYIVRDGYYHNGYYILVGAYSVDVRITYPRSGLPDLDTGFYDAWDGFVLLVRGFSVLKPPAFAQSMRDTIYAGFPSSSIPDSLPDLTSFCFFPMRFPYLQSQCGTLSSAFTAAELTDSNQGLYGVRPYKSGDNIGVFESPSQDNIVVDVCGYYNIPTVGAEPSLSIFAGQPSKPYWASITFNIAEVVAGGSLYEWDATKSIEMVWGGANNQAPLDAEGIVYGKFGIVRDIDEMATVANGNINPQEYTKELWEQGCKPDGTNPFGGITMANSQRAFDNGYAITKFLGMDNFSELQIFGGNTIEGTFDCMAGECYLYNTTTGNVETNIPIITMLNMNPGDLLGLADGGTPFSDLAPWSMSLPAWIAPVQRTFAIPDALWLCDNFDDILTPVPWTKSWAVDIIPPAESCGIPSGGGDTGTIGYIVVNGFIYDKVNTTTVINTIEFSQLWGANGVTENFAGAGGYFTGATGIPLPQIYKTKCQQVRTFTTSEEAISKGTDGRNGVDDFDQPIGYVQDFDTEEYVGVIGNYPRLPTYPDGEIPTASGFGVRSNIGFAFAGGNDPTGTGGPSFIAYDTNYNNQTVDPSAPQTLSRGDLVNAGPALNQAILSGTATNRQVISGRWDNDRDQWLITTYDPTNKWSIVSVDSKFETYLDQTQNFTNIPADREAAMYIPITMSNSLDGIMLFGLLEDNTWGKTGIRSTTPTTFTTSANIGRTFATDSNFSMVRIKGSTGREARVWIDYMLYDGVDSLIAMQLSDWGLRVSIENVEWFKARLLQGGDLKAKAEEIETWMEAQGQQYQEMLKQKERSGRLRRRRSQISAYKREVDDILSPDTIDTEVYEFVPKGASASLRKDESGNALLTPPPTSIEAMVERDYRAGFDKTPSGVLKPGEQAPETPGEAAGAFMDTGDAPKKGVGEGGDPDEEYVGEDGG